MQKLQKIYLLAETLGQNILVFFDSILNFTTYLWQSISGYILKFLEKFLEQLNPSLFQNVILGVLIIYIFVSEFISNQIKEKLEKTEIIKEIVFSKILNFHRIIIAISILIFFSSFGNSLNINTFDKFLTLFILVCCICYLLLPLYKLKKILRGKIDEEIILHLKKTKTSKILKSKNKDKLAIMINDWQKIWVSEKLTYQNEVDFTEIFVTRIDDFIKLKKFYFARQLFEIYLNNFQNRINLFWIGYSLLPKILDWDEKFWQEELKKNKLWKEKNNRNTQNVNTIRSKIEKIFSNLKNYFPISIVKKISDQYEKNFAVRDGWLQYDYFRSACLLVIVKELLKQESHHFFLVFKKHTQRMEKKLNKIKADTDDKQKYNSYINKVFRQFFFTFFENINSYRYRDYFPNEWRIIKDNKYRKITLLRILYEFRQWAIPIAFHSDKEDKKLTAVIELLFPRVHPGLFAAFLALLFNSQREIKYAIEKKANFQISSSSIIFTPSEDENENRILQSELLKQEENKQKEETVQIILNFFTRLWEILIYYQDDLEAKDSRNWDNIQEIDKEEIIKNIRIKKLEKTKAELKSPEIEKICDEEYKKDNRNNSIELIDLLIKELRNQPKSEQTKY